MKHIKQISLFQSYQGGETTTLEAIILIVFGVLFRDFDNFAAVMQNLQKFYEKT